MKAIDDDVLNRLRLGAFEAAADARCWRVFVDDVARAFGATSCILHSSSNTACGGIWIDNHPDPAAVPLYGRHWRLQDPWANHPRGHRSSVAGRCFIGSDLVPWPQLKRTAFYNEFGRRAGLKGVMSALVDDGRAADPWKLVVFREDGLPDFAPPQLRAFQALQPSLRKALQSFMALRQLHAQASAVELTLEAMPSPVFVLRRDGWLEHANGLARGWWSAGAARVIAGRIEGMAQICGSRWRDALLAAAAGVPQQLGLWLPEQRQVSTASLLMSAVARDTPVAGHWPRADILVVIQQDNTARTRQARLEALASRCRLTPVELQVLRRLADGEPPESVAQAQGVTLYTVRTHIRHLLEKTSTSRMVDLVRLVGC